MKTLVLTASAAKQLDALAAQARATAERALDSYAMEGLGDVKNPRDRDGFRLRIGDIASFSMRI